MPSVKTLLQVLNTHIYVHRKHIRIFAIYICEIVYLLFQAAWEEVEQSLVELAQTRARVQQLRNQLQGRKKDAELEVSTTGDELHNDTLAL